MVGLPALTFAAGAITLTVTAVDGSGAITRWVLRRVGCCSAIPIRCRFRRALRRWRPRPNRLGGGNGSGATFMARFVLPQKPAWLTELNRLRNNLYAVPNFMTPSTALAVSGPWPVAGPDPNYLYNTMYFPASGSAVDVTMTVNIPGELSGKNNYAFHGESYSWAWSSPNGVFDQIAGQTLRLPRRPMPPLGQSLSKNTHTVQQVARRQVTLSPMTARWAVSLASSARAR